MIKRFESQKIWLSWGLIFCFALFIQASGASVRRSDAAKNEEISSGKVTGYPGIFEEEGSPEGKAKKKKSILPWIIGGVAAVAVGCFFINILVTDLDQFTLTVILASYVTGEPKAGTYKYKRGTQVDYSYTSSQRFDVHLDRLFVNTSGSFWIYGNRVLEVRDWD